MKKLLFAAAVMLMSLTASAQQKAPVALEKAPHAFDNGMKVGPKKAEANGIILGGYTSDTYTTNGIGYKMNVNISVAQVIPASMLKPFDGGRIVSLRFALCNDKGPATRVFVAPVVDNEVQPDVLSKEVTWQQEGWCKVDFDDSYTINSEEVDQLLIGYDLQNVAGGYQMSIVEEGTILPSWVYGPLANDGSSAWFNMGTEDFGNLSIQVYVDGVNVDNEYGVTTYDFGEVRTEVNKEVNANVSFIGGGSEPITSLTYDVLLNNEVKGTYTADINPGVVYASPGSFEATFPAVAEGGVYDAIIRVNKINGNDITAVDCKGKFIVVPKVVERGAVVEEFTGTTCGWCPRGWVGMEKMREKFGDQFVGIAIHKFNSSDPMFPTSYANLQFGGAPSCMINRGEVMDPYYGTTGDICNDVDAVLAVPTTVGIKVSGEYNENCTEVNAKAEIEAIVEGGPYKIEYVLIADGLEGSTNDWKQSNYYSQYSQNQFPEDMAPFCSGGEHGQSTIFLVFNDVAIASSYTGGTNKATAPGTMAAGEVKENTFTLTMPTKAKLKNAILIDKVAVCAFIVNPDGTIENGAKFYLQPTPEQLGIENVNNSSEMTEVARYTVDGRQIMKPQSGINIVKMSDGTIMKVMVK